MTVEAVAHGPRPAAPFAVAKQWAAILIACSLGATSASAQPTIKSIERPDPASVTVPDLAFKPGRRDPVGYDDYFYFHKSGVSYERAFADMDQCRIQGEMAQIVAPIPRFIPLGGEPVNRPERDRWAPFAMYGVIGMIMADIIIESVQEDLAMTTGRKCLAYKGYHRYGTTRTIYKQIDSGADAEKLARKARIASGPPPQAEALVP
jgi:hypothetical protein